MTRSPTIPCRFSDSLQHIHWQETRSLPSRKNLDTEKISLCFHPFLDFVPQSCTMSSLKLSLHECYLLSHKSKIVENTDSMLSHSCSQVYNKNMHADCAVGSVQSLSPVRLCDPMDCSSPGFPVHHQLLELTQTHVHRVSDAIQPSHPLLSPSPPALSLSQHQSLFQ